MRLILFHGLASTPKEFGLLVHPLRRLGVDLQAPEIPGYSHSSLSETPRWLDWVDAAADWLDARAGPAGSPVVIGGMCTGAMLALAVARRPTRVPVRGLALLSPLFAYDGWALPWWYRLRHLAYALRLDGLLAMQERPPYGLKNERMRDWVRQQLQAGGATLVGPASVPLRVIRESERLSRHALEALGFLHLPTSVLHAREDEICSLRSVEAALATAGPTAPQLQVLEDSYHMISADNDRQQVAETLAAFTRRLAPAPATTSLT